MRRTLALIGFWVLGISSLVAAGGGPPSGIAWKDTLDAAKADAKTRGVPVLLYVGGSEGGSKTMTQSLEDPGVIRLLRHFSCAYVSRDYKIDNFRAAYVPWIGKTAQTTHSTPLLVFGDPQGNVNQDFRSEGKSLSAEELSKHLEKVLASLAPAELQKVRGDILTKASLPAQAKLLSDSLDQVESFMAPDKLTAFRDELQWAMKVCKGIESKLTDLKAKEDRDLASTQLKELKTQIANLGKYKAKEKEAETFAGYLRKAKDAQKALSEVVDPKK